MEMSFTFPGNKSETLIIFTDYFLHYLRLEQAGVDVAELQIKLTDMQPVLKKTQVEVEEMMVQLAKDKEEAEKTKEVVSKQEESANKQAEECAAIKEDAEADLAKVKQIFLP